VASSADGTRLVAGAEGPSLLAYLDDSGVTWTARDSSRRWLAVACSADGVTDGSRDFTGKLYTSVGTPPAAITYTAPTTAGTRDFTFQVQDDGVGTTSISAPTRMSIARANTRTVAGSGAAEAVARIHLPPSPQPDFTGSYSDAESDPLATAAPSPRCQPPAL